MTYKWQQLGKREQDEARRMTERFWKQDIKAATVSQVAKYLDDCRAYDEDAITLDELYARTGWAR